MLVYGDSITATTVRNCMSELFAVCESIANTRCQDHEVITELLIEHGEFESALTDDLSPERDEWTPTIAALKTAGVLTGDIAVCSHQELFSEAHAALTTYERELRNLALILPDKPLKTKTPEGYAFYALYPEMYLQAAVTFYENRAPARVICIGIRSIGTSLSSIVTAALRRIGICVEAYTVRPRGDCFDRRIVLSRELSACLTRELDAHYLVADEGPGLSGSSFCSVARMLSEYGVTDDRIVFIPSWIPDVGSLRSEHARKVWPLHEKYVCGFEELWFAQGRKAKLFPSPGMRDLSAGRWRSLLYEPRREQPAVYPYTERRKYLYSPPHSEGKDALSRDSGIFWKFAGLGKHGKATYRRAEVLHQLGFGPEPLRLTRGFIAYRFGHGRPLAASERSPEFLHFAARYIIAVEREFPAPASRSWDEMLEMVRANTAEGLGADWANRILRRADTLQERYSSTATAVDGRMQPWEWLRTAFGFIKTDATDHHNDHFFPGRQHIAWDVTGFMVEFRFTPDERKNFLERYFSAGGKSDVRARLPFYTIAYLAFRLGYCVFAAETLGDTQDGRGFLSLAEYYGGALKTAILDLDK